MGGNVDWVTPHKQVKKWYTSDPTNFEDLAVHEHMRSCLGLPVYRVDMTTKDIKGRGVLLRSNLMTVKLSKKTKQFVQYFHAGTSSMGLH
jgi:hypothetical protein